MDPVLVKLQLELQEQLQPTPAQDAAGNEPAKQLLVARLAPVADDVTPQHDDVTPQQDDVIQQQGEVTDSLHSEITLRWSSGSVASLQGMLRVEMCPRLQSKTHLGVRGQGRGRAVKIRGSA